MKKISLKKDYVAIIILVVITLILTLPGLFIPRMLIDDGESIRGAMSIQHSIQVGDYTHIFYEETNLRLFRPIYWLWQLLNFSLFGLNILGMRLMLIILQISTSILIYITGKKYIRQTLASFLMAFFYLIFSPAGENMYRLGTGEPVIVVLLLLYLLLLKVSKSHLIYFFMAMIVIFAAYFAKPTVIILIPVTIAWIILENYKSFVFDKKNNIIINFLGFFKKNDWYAFLLAVNLLAFGAYLLIRKLINI